MAKVHHIMWTLFTLISSIISSYDEKAACQKILEKAGLEGFQCSDSEACAIIRERETAKKAIEEAPPVIQGKEVLVEDTKKVESLIEVESLKSSLETEKLRADEAEGKYKELQ
ncbi:hypothetical protein GOBAR_DD25978 [Gossypium barbadense]|nr:hypothetical protein GOBAR_DD25978 [Gossypium barbadense]